MGVQSQQNSKLSAFFTAVNCYVIPTHESWHTQQRYSGIVLELTHTSTGLQSKHSSYHSSLQYHKGHAQTAPSANSLTAAAAAACFEAPRWLVALLPLPLLLLALFDLRCPQSCACTSSSTSFKAASMRRLTSPGGSWETAAPAVRRSFLDASSSAPQKRRKEGREWSETAVHYIVQGWCSVLCPVLFSCILLPPAPSLSCATEREEKGTSR